MFSSYKHTYLFHWFVLPAVIASVIGIACTDIDNSTPSFQLTLDQNIPHHTGVHTDAHSESTDQQSNDMYTASDPMRSQADMSLEEINSGRQLYQFHCSACHGTSAQGASAQALLPWNEEPSQLQRIIDTRMPLSNPQECSGECAQLITTYLLSLPDDFTLDCSQVTLPPQRLRLLTRYEYMSTLRDLFSTDQVSHTPCTQDQECELAQQSCIQQSCRRDECYTHTFILPGYAQASSVLVAGSFNHWSIDGTSAVSMTRDDRRNVWWVKMRLEVGRFEYKFVVNGNEWILDPQQSIIVDNGLGGQNSAVDIECGVFEVTQDESTDLLYNMDILNRLPIEIRPEHFWYETHHQAMMTPQHLSVYFEYAQWITQQLDAQTLTSCDLSQRDEACLARFIRTFLRKAMRRPAQEDEVIRYQQLFMRADDWYVGLQVFMQVLLSSPQFLYKSSLGVNYEDHYRLTAFEVASELSYMLWGSMPDEALLQAAEEGHLESDAEIYQQAQRMLQDDKAKRYGALFVKQWLGIEKVQTADKNPLLFPQYDAALRHAFLTESEKFFQHLLFDQNAVFADLLQADFTFMNQRLADFYQVDFEQMRIEQESADSYWYRFPNTDGRSGLLGHASVLSASSHSDQSSPIKRGLFVRQRLLCQSFPEPPANAGGVPEVDPSASTRERFRQHSDDPTCQTCHQYIDGLGFGFENYDAVGQWRTHENGIEIDSLGEMIDLEGIGTGSQQSFHHLSELAELLAESESAPDCFAQNYLSFVRGSQVDDAQQCELLALQDAFQSEGYRLQSLLLAITQLPGFRYKRAQQ